MRLICPNCGAQYEIDADLIPKAGRDVQCSDCAHTWFETPGASLAREASPVDLEELPDVPAQPEDPTPPEPAQPDPPDTAAPRAHALPKDVERILREEARHEQRQREAERLEVQPDLGLHISETPPRRERLPDIEDINSSLREDTPRAEGTPADPPRRDRFWHGFLLITLLAAIAFLIYMFSQQISDILPVTEPALSAYTDWVDKPRLQLFDIVQTVQTPKAGNR